MTGELFFPGGTNRPRHGDTENVQFTVCFASFPLHGHVLLVV
jgi:hypothetical protein